LGECSSHEASDTRPDHWRVARQFGRRDDARGTFGNLVELAGRDVTGELGPDLVRGRCRVLADHAREPGAALRQRLAAPICR
jgi:hypothetical protein